MSKKNKLVLTQKQAQTALTMVRVVLCESLLSRAAGKIVPTIHVKDRKLERRARPVDLVTVLMNGRIGTFPKQGKFPGELKFRIDGYDTTGVALAVVVAIDLRLRRLTFVTVSGHNSDAGNISGVAALISYIYLAGMIQIYQSCWNDRSHIR